MKTVDPDPFDEELARVPLRPPPPAWRAEILAGAPPASCRHERPRGTGWQPVLHPIRLIRERWTPVRLQSFGGLETRGTASFPFSVWSVVAAAWLVILALNRLAGSGDSPAGSVRPLPPEFLAALRAQQAELLRLAELDPPDPAPPPAPAASEEKPRARGPRAQGGGENASASWLAAQAGSSKSQVPGSKEIPSLKLQPSGAAEELELGSWSSFGAWSSELGA